MTDFGLPVDVPVPMVLGASAVALDRSKKLEYGGSRESYFAWANALLWHLAGNGLALVAFVIGKLPGF